MIDRSDPHWYRDAVIYQVHVKSFLDANDDGIGDFEGLTRRLDYIRDLGATAVWVMPFYPSPLRDDGYDIADYRGVNPSYGTLRDFRRFVQEAHERGLRVITELVINHTSDQHPWFQRARQARPGSAARDFYVWSDTPERYAGTRVIFLDTEPSNWTWDPVAKAYYWHRFYSHQPDLNFDNPRVLVAVLQTMRYWLDMGVDGLRLDAIPYLIEREGTNCENLPETHDVIRRIRAHLDRHYPDRMLLAEANQWPEETARYFGQGDECQMAFHFPLMPRMYMAIAQEDRHPVTDIMRQTPEIPEGAQWAIFLRNHDELTLEMVTDRERDYLWTFYAADRRARINLGIRRRLAPLLENDRRKVELMMSLLLSMPGTPVIYYGDEIGMGDNIYLGDRDGVRTPMQWSPDRNAGFSRCDPARLFLPTVQDPTYGFGAVNVEAQLASPGSLLNWTRRMLAIRGGRRVFGRGALRFLYPANRKVLAYVREAGDERILCVANVSRAPQAVELDLSEWRGAVPVELTGGTSFPPVGDLPYLMTLPAYGFYWFALMPAQEQARFGPHPPPELFTLVLTGTAASLMEGRERTAFERNVVPGILPERRWFAGKGRRIAEVTVETVAAMPGPAQEFLLARVAVRLADGERQRYFVPLSVEEGREEEALLPHAVARVRRGPRMGLLVDAEAVPAFALALADGMRRGDVLPARDGGTVRLTGTPLLADLALPGPDEVRRAGVEQSNSTVVLGTAAVLKLLRRSVDGLHPELEMARHLAAAGFAATPPLLGAAEAEAQDGTMTALAVLQGFVRHQGDAWTWAVGAVEHQLETSALVDVPAGTGEQMTELFLPHVEVLGRRAGELHAVLARPSADPAFAPEPLADEDVAAVAADARAQAARAFEALARRADLPGAQDLLARRAELDAVLGRLAAPVSGAVKTRIHGDFHLGQVLIVRDDVMITDFEGEPSRPLVERRAKASPLRDVAGMLRSFDYAAAVASRALAERLPDAAGRIAAGATRLVDRLAAAFLDSYARAAGDAVPDAGERRRLLALHVLAKALYELAYEGDNRPGWLPIPLAAVLRLLDDEAAR